MIFKDVKIGERFILKSDTKYHTSVVYQKLAEYNRPLKISMPISDPFDDDRYTNICPVNVFGLMAGNFQLIKEDEPVCVLRG